MCRAEGECRLHLAGSIVQCTKRREEEGVPYSTARVRKAGKWLSIYSLTFLKETMEEETSR